jgi:hypothetical protein
VLAAVTNKRRKKMTTRRRTENKKKKIVERRIIVGVEDMVMLTDTRDVGIVDNLQTRLVSSNIYTYIGHVLVVCNPYKWLSIYEKEIMKQYIHQVDDLPPSLPSQSNSINRLELMWPLMSLLLQKLLIEIWSPKKSLSVSSSLGNQGQEKLKHQNKFRF